MIVAHPGQTLWSAIFLRNIILMSTLCPGRKIVSQSPFKSICRLELVSCIANSPRSIFWAPDPTLPKLIFNTDMKACACDCQQEKKEYVQLREFHLGRPHEFEMKRCRLPQSVQQVYWLLSLYLAWDPGNNVLNVAHHLKHLEIGVPWLCQRRFRRCKKTNILHDFSCHTQKLPSLLNTTDVMISISSSAKIIKCTVPRYSICNLGESTHALKGCILYPAS